MLTDMGSLGFKKMHFSCLNSLNMLKNVNFIKGLGHERFSTQERK